MLTLLLTRHGHTTKSTPEQYLGQRVAASLSTQGRREARALRRRLEGVEIERIIASPLGRAQETARIVAGGRDVETDARLTELDYGKWEGLTVDQIERSFPGERALYEADPARHRVGGGESGRQVAARLRPMVDALVDWAHAGHRPLTCLLVGHSSVNRVLIAMLLAVPLIDYRRRFRQDWANLTVLQWPDVAAGPELVLFNDMTHITGAKGATWER